MVTLQAGEFGNLSCNCFPGDSKWPLYPLVGGHLNFPKGHLTIPKRSQRIASFFCFSGQPVVDWVVVSKSFYFHLYLGKIPMLTNILRWGWNHQLAMLNWWFGSWWFGIRIGAHLLFQSRSIPFIRVSQESKPPQLQPTNQPLADIWRWMESYVNFDDQEKTLRIFGLDPQICHRVRSGHDSPISFGYMYVYICF